MNVGEIYQETANEQLIENASPHRLIQMLFEKYLQYLAVARKKINSQKSDIKIEEIDKAIRILSYLRTCLARPDEKTSKLSDELDQVYALAILALKNVYEYHNIKDLDLAERVILTIKTAWDHIQPK